MLGLRPGNVPCKMTKKGFQKGSMCPVASFLFPRVYKPESIVSSNYAESKEVNMVKKNNLFNDAFIFVFMVIFKIFIEMTSMIGSHINQASSIFTLARVTESNAYANTRNTI